MHLSVSAAACYLGVSVSTLRRWDKSRTFSPDFVTVGKHRRYSLASLRKFVSNNSPKYQFPEVQKTILYSRVSSHDQRGDLKRQSHRLIEFSKQKKFENCELIEDLGSGLNYKKPGLSRLLFMVLHGKVQRLVIHDKDRLLRFGSELIFNICKVMDVHVEIVEASNDQSFEQELAANVLEVMTVFTSKLYGRRAHRNRLRKVS